MRYNTLCMEWGSVGILGVLSGRAERTIVSLGI